jgi:hypothetical protein
MTKKYILKPGKHQFAPGSHAVHDNDNLSDKEAQWYLDKYPHIAVLFENKPGKKMALGIQKEIKDNSLGQSVQSAQESAKIIKQ